jgi:hypothetical protein
VARVKVILRFGEIQVVSDFRSPDKVELATVMGTDRAVRSEEISR